MKSAKGRICEGCGVRMPFGVSRRRKDDKLVCDGCINDRPGMPRSQVTRQGAHRTAGAFDEVTSVQGVSVVGRVGAFPLKRGNCFVLELFTPGEQRLVVAMLDLTTPIGQLDWSPGGKIGQLFVEPRFRRDGVASALLAAARQLDPSVHHSPYLTDDGAAFSQAVASMNPNALVRQAILKQAEFPPKKKDDSSKSDGGDKGSAGGAAPPPPPAGHPAGPHMMQQGMGPNMGMHPGMMGMPMGMPGMMPGMPGMGAQPPGTMQQFAPDQKSDLIVRVCPFCGSGHLIGRSDGSIECGYDNTVFTVTVMPSHPFQPLVNPDGSPFSMPEDPNADPHPQIGTASPASTPGDGPADALAGETPAGQAPAGQSPSAPVPPGVPPAAPGAPGATSQPGAPGGGPLDHAFEQAVAEAEGGAPGVPEDQGDSDDPQAADHDKDAPDAKKGDEDDDNKPPWLQKKKSALFGWDPNDPEDAEPYVNDFRVHNCASVLKQATRAPEYLTASGEYLGEDAYVAYLRDRVLPHA